MPLHPKRTPAPIAALAMALAGLLPGCTFDTGVCDLSGHPVEKSSDAITVKYSITEQTYNAENGRLEQTPCAVKQKIKAAFDLWESVPGVPLRFEYFGAGAAGLGNRISTGSRVLTIDLTGQGDFPSGVTGLGSSAGTPPDSYSGGQVLFNTQAGLYALRMKTVVHEIGHALGLPHSATNSSIMSCGTPTWGDHEFLAFSAQDRADLAGLWGVSNGGSATSLYTVSGSVTGDKAGAFHYVYAVNIENGLSFSDLSEADGQFKINIPVAGSYRVVAKSYEVSQEEFGVVPSWYVAGSTASSTNDPVAGTVLALSDANPTVADVTIPMIAGTFPFHLFWSTTEDPVSFNHAFIAPGGSGKVLLEYIAPGLYESISTYGTAPDYTISGVTQHVGYDGALTDSVELTLTISAGAPQGDRIVVARAVGSSVVQVGLVGIHVSGSKYPSYVDKTPVEQFNGLFDFTSLDPGYWK